MVWVKLPRCPGATSNLSSMPRGVQVQMSWPGLARSSSVVLLAGSRRIHRYRPQLCHKTTLLGTTLALLQLVVLLTAFPSGLLAEKSMVGKPCQSSVQLHGRPTRTLRRHWYRCLQGPATTGERHTRARGCKLCRAAGALSSCSACWFLSPSEDTLTTTRLRDSLQKVKLPHWSWQTSCQSRHRLLPVPTTNLSWSSPMDRCMM